MKFNVENFSELLNKDLEKETAAFKKKNDREPSIDEVSKLKVLIGYETVERYLKMLEDSVKKDSSEKVDKALVSKVTTVRSQWNRTLNANLTETNSHETLLVNFVEYIKWFSADNKNVTFEALGNFLNN